MRVFRCLETEQIFIQVTCRVNKTASLLGGETRQDFRLIFSHHTALILDNTKKDLGLSVNVQKQGNG